MVSPTLRLKCRAMDEQRRRCQTSSSTAAAIGRREGNVRAMRATQREIFAPDLLSDKRILITGGGTGLGRGVAARLVKHGAEVHLWGRREAVLASAAEEVSQGRLGAVHFQAVDVRDSAAVEGAVGQ